MEWTYNGFTLRPARAEDAEAYYLQNYCPLDPEVARLTGSKAVFTREEVISFFLRSLEDGDRRFFLLTAPEGQIIGEAVLTDIDWDLRCANFRICLFREKGRGLGTWATQRIRDYAFGELGLHRVELDVYSFNPRAMRVYEKAGFRREGVRRDAIRDGDGYADDILMAMLESDWNLFLQK
ncbi:MAG: GNAT family protein [Eubacteriales bacterium]|nr:GNAT family protein [Eubacteriales bacterium]